MNHIRKFFLCAVACSAMLAVFPTSVAAATGPWAWSDASSQVTVRANRPVWAMAYAKPYWFYTDGQDLSTSGHVWRTDGTNSVDITSDVKQAGFSRVDAIVSDGTTVTYIGPGTAVPARKNYSDGTTIFLADGANARTIPVPPDPVFASIDWKNAKFEWNGASWMILSGKDLIRFDGTSFQYLGKTRDFFTTIASDGNGTFLLGGAASNDAIANGPQFPLSAKLVMVNEDIAKPMYAADSFGGGASNAVTNGPSIKTTGNLSTFAVGNGGTFVYRVTSSDGAGIDHVDVYVNGARVKTCYAAACDYENMYFTNGQTTRMIPFSASATDKLGVTVNTTKTPDVLTVNASGATAVVSAVTSNPVATSDTITQGNSAGIAFWTWISPNRNTIALDQSATYNVGSWSAKGVQRMDIYVNGAVRGACSYGSATIGNQSCSVTLTGKEFAAGTKASVNTKVTATDGQIGWTQLQQIAVIDPSVSVAFASPAPATNPNVSTWTWIEPNLSAMDYRGSAVFKAQADTTSGINRIDLYVNGAVRRMCDFARAFGTQTCDITLNGMEFSVGSSVTLAAKATAASGDSVWSPARAIAIRDDMKDAGLAPAVIKTWMSPTVDSVKGADVVTYFAQAQDVDGITKIEILSDNTVTQTCAFTNAYSPVECSQPISAALFPGKTSVNAMTRVSDAKGNVTLSDTRYFAVTK